MSKIIILILSLLVLSCAPAKIVSGTDIKIPVMDSDGDGVVDVVENETSLDEVENVVNATESTGGYIKLMGKQKQMKHTKPNVIDYTEPTKTKEKGFGTVAYNIPSKLEVNKFYTIKLRISRTNGNIESIIIGDRKIPITLNNDEVIIENIKIDSLMTARLFADSKSFEIELTSLAEQKIQDDGYTEWVWRVRPLKSGECYLKLLITISGKDIVVYEKNIPVESNWKWSFTNWIKTWWQIIATTLLIPIAIPVFKWWFARKKKEEEDK